MEKPTVGVVGQGFVGGSLTKVLGEQNFKVHAYDKAGVYQDNAISYVSLEAMIESLMSEDSEPVIFVCLPTPMKRSGEADLRIVDGVLNEMANMDLPITAVVKSTIPPGTTENWNQRFSDDLLNVVFNPEFLTEANAVNDMRDQNRIIVGGPRPYSGKVSRVFRQAFPDVKVIKTSSTIAETVKYFTNCLLATKVSFANEMKQICEGLGIDYDKVLEYSLHDERIGKTHLYVPGPDGSPGFGGHCFPKDLNALMFVASQIGVTPSVMQGVWDKNEEVRSDRDWENQVGRAVSDE